MIPYKSKILDLVTDDKYQYEIDYEANDTLLYTVNFEFINSDTTIQINYRNYGVASFDGISGCTLFKSYYKDEVLNELCLFNSDTLFHYTILSEIKSPRFFLDYEFIKGKYLFMGIYNCGFASSSQHVYLLQCIDSLKNVRGNDLPELPKSDYSNLREFMETDEYREIHSNNLYL
ncbi:hypothetical protein L3073_14040 [Ancylomarina sp. DW003]|nr:hypothetical protein [Ancylomarina sp. DW003]MDE5423336.1 hypothetical protein [Ancylomarina sp. DW003]